MNAIARRPLPARAVLSALVIVAVAGAAHTAHAAPIVVRSGQVGGSPGLPGQFDDIVTYLPNNPPGGQISASAFTAADFAGAVAGPAAELIVAHPAWTPGISDPAARWINWQADRQANPAGGPPSFLGNPGSSLYAVPFFVPGSGVLSAALTLELAVDDSLGDWFVSGPNPAGVYINGTPLPLYTAANYATPTTYSTTINVNGGATNYLYFYQRDLGVLVSGIIFSASINVPTPGAAAVLGLGGLALARRRRR